MLQLSCLQTVYNCVVPFDCSQYSLNDSDFLIVSAGHTGDKIEKNEMGGACSACGRGERRVQGFAGET